ncbi:MAG: FAD binding domain-containing protein [Vicinamibacterales bacterium]
MQTFEWVDATSVEQAAALLAEDGPGRSVVAKAGGIDLIDLMKEGIVRPARVVNLKSIPGLSGIGSGGDGALTIGALVTLAQIEQSLDIRQRLPALAKAAEHAATPQVRNAATIGGNLLQRPRCWYFRNALFHQDGHDPAAAAISGQNQYHAIFDNATSAMVHASTPATALLAYDAEVELASAQGGTRRVALKDFLLPPDARRDRDAAIRAGEILVRVHVPALAGTIRAAYHKQTERESYDWPICDVAVVLQMDGEVVKDARVALGWVAPTPRRAHTCERALIGRPLTAATAREAAAAAVAGATPLPQNGYKVPVLEAVVRRTILAASPA